MRIVCVRDSVRNLNSFFFFFWLFLFSAYPFERERTRRKLFKNPVHIIIMTLARARPRRELRTERACYGWRKFRTTFITVYIYTFVIRTYSNLSERVSNGKKSRRTLEIEFRNVTVTLLQVNCLSRVTHKKFHALRHDNSGFFYHQTSVYVKSAW